MQIVFGLLGGLAVFIYGMNLMSESLQKAAGEKMKSILALLTKNRIMGVIAGALGNCCIAEQQCYHGHGHWFCQRRTYESASGNFDYFRSKYWYYYDRTDYSL